MYFKRIEMRGFKSYVPHYRWILYSRRPSGLLLGIGYKLWLRLKPWLNTQKTGSGDGAG